MAKYIGLDLGSKTIGIATSEGFFAQSKATIRFKENDFVDAIDKLKTFLNKEKFEKLIIGYPKNMNGSIGHRIEMVEEIIALIIKENIATINNIEKIDERLTTSLAKQIMIEANLSRKKQKENKDQLAAKLILETYLNLIN